MSKDKPLTVEIVDGVLNISLGIDILCLATQSEIYDFKIVDNNGFSNDIINELLSEEEDGTTLVHRMLDEAANNAIENGSEYIEEIGEDE
jgi:hypothetical protein